MNADLQTQVRELSAALILERAGSRAVLQAVVELFHSVGKDSIDGVPLGDWVDARRWENVQAALIRVEDDDPALAAILQGLIDEHRK